MWRFIRSASCTIFLFYILTNNINAQILKDTATLNLITRGISDIYNRQFKDAEDVYILLAKSYPEHPIKLLFKGMMIYWENYPLLPSSQARVPFEESMRRCIDLCEKNKVESYAPEMTLANLCARGFLLLFYADNDLSNEVTPLAIGTYPHLKRSFKLTSVCADFYYFTGVYNYYREAYPNIYPIYKALAFLFPSGNMEKGIKELETSAQGSIALRAESYFMLYWIFMNFEGNYDQALHYCKSLTDQYPLNYLHKAMYIKNLLLLKKYDEAEKFIASNSDKESNSFYLAQLSIFRGIIQEKKYHNYPLAAEFYNKGIHDLSMFNTYGNEFAAYGYFGLSRIGEINGDSHERRINRRKAMDIVDFKKINFDE
jgi:hypothetical protein